MLRAMGALLRGERRRPMTVRLDVYYTAAQFFPQQALTYTTRK